MKNKASITALMSLFGRAFHAENEEHPVFEDYLARKLMTAEEYAAVQGYILDGAQFFEPEIDPAKQESTELLRRIVFGKMDWIPVPTVQRWTDVRHWDALPQTARLFWKT